MLGCVPLLFSSFSHAAVTLEPVMIDIPLSPAHTFRCGSLEIVKTALEILSHQYPQAKETDASLIIDTSIMKHIEQSGFIKALYKK
jgi:hypothetical protein